MPRPRPTPKKGHKLYQSLQAAWRFVLNLEPPNWKTVERIHEELRSLEAQGYDRPVDHDPNDDLEIE